MARPASLFFYGTLMTGHANRQAAGIDPHVTYVGRGWIAGRLFDLGAYPAAVPDDTGRVHGELHVTSDAEALLARLDDFEGVVPGDPSASLYRRDRVSVHLDDGRVVEDVWVYFYNQPLDGAPPIPSGDYRRPPTSA